MSTSAPEPGLHFDVPFDVYMRWPCVSQSGLKKLARSPGHYQHYLAHPREPSKAMQIGSALDDGWLVGPDELAKRYTTVPWPTPLKKNGKPYSNWLVSNDGEAWKAEQEEAGRTVLSIYDAFAIYGMMLALDAHPIASDLRRRAKTQVSFVWVDPATGVLCKSRVDMLVEPEPPYTVIDLKSTGRELNPLSEYDPFRRQAAELGYDKQAGFYCGGLEVLTGVPHDDYRVIAVEQAAPHTVEVYRYLEGDILIAQEEMGDLLRLYAQCKSGEVDWDRTSTNQEHVLSVPHWARR